MKKIPVWIDCTAGTDDFSAIALTQRLDEFEIEGISVLYGKGETEKAFESALAIRDLLGADWPVYRGAEKPLLKDAEICGGDPLIRPVRPLPEGNESRDFAWEALLHCAKEHDGQLRLITLGPLTNIAAAFMKYPELAGLLHSLTVKGGAAIFGDVTPAAERSIYADPQAADIVFRAGAKMNVLFREATSPITLGEEELAGLEESGNEALCACLRAALAAGNASRVSVGDTCAVMFLVYPELFTLDEVGVAVETRGSITNGRTVTDAYSDQQFPFKNATAALGTDRGAFLCRLTEAFRKR